jgi:hypothetical protein
MDPNPTKKWRIQSLVIALCVTAPTMASDLCVAVAFMSSDFCVAAGSLEVAVDERCRTCGYFDEVGAASLLARRRRQCDAGQSARSDLCE